MALQVSFFKAIVSVNGSNAEVPAGLPIDVQSSSPVTVPAGAVFMRLHPQGGTNTVTWSNGKTEYFDSPEFRGCTPADTFSFA